MDTRRGARTHINTVTHRTEVLTHTHTHIGAHAHTHTHTHTLTLTFWLIFPRSKCDLVLYWVRCAIADFENQCFLAFSINSKFPSILETFRKHQNLTNTHLIMIWSHAQVRFWSTPDDLVLDPNKIWSYSEIWFCPRLKYDLVPDPNMIWSQTQIWFVPWPK